MLDIVRENGLRNEPDPSLIASCFLRLQDYFVSTRTLIRPNFLRQAEFDFNKGAPIQCFAFNYKAKCFEGLADGWCR